MVQPGRLELRRDAGAAAFLITLPTLFFADVLLGLANFAMRDLTRYYYPTKQIYRRIVYGGEFPLWNRYFHGGQPLAANPEHEIFYPLTWLTFLPSYDLGYRLHILAHVYIALFGMYALLRSMRAHRGAALFAAISWGMGGLYLSYINLLPIFFCAAWLPLTCLYARRFLIGRAIRDFALASLFLGIQCLVAEPTTVLQSGFLIGMYGLYRGWHGPETADGEVDVGSRAESSRLMVRGRRMLTNTGWIGLISLCAFAVGAVQMMSAMDHAGDSARARPFAFELVSAWSMPLGKLAELVYPNVLGHVQLDGEIRYWASALYERRGAPFIFSVYPGLAVAALVAAGVLCRIRGWAFLMTLAVFSTVVALGDGTPLLRFLYDAGIAQSIRYPEKFVLIGIFAGTVFAARALERILSGDERLRNAAAGFALATAIIAGSISLIGFRPSSVHAWMTFFDLPPASETFYYLSLAWDGWRVATLRGLLLFLLLLSALSVHRRLWWAAAAIFLCADLGPVVHQLNPRLPARFFTGTPEVLTTLAPNRGEFRVFHEADWFGGDQVGLVFPRGDATYWITRNGLFPTFPVAYDVRTVLDRDYDETSLLRTIDYLNAMWKVRASGRRDWYRPFMAMSNAWYRGVIADESQWQGREVERAMPVQFIEGPHHPRYYFAETIVQTSGADDFARKLSTASYPDRVAFIGRPPFVPAEGKVTGIRERSNGAIIDVTAEGRAFLVMSVTAHKYWKVTVDGRPVEAIVTNIGYQGVVVPPGRHRVEMTYRNGVMIAGAVVSAAALTLIIGVLIGSRRRRPAVT